MITLTEETPEWLTLDKAFADDSYFAIVDSHIGFSAYHTFARGFKLSSCSMRRVADEVDLSNEPANLSPAVRAVVIPKAVTRGEQMLNKEAVISQLTGAINSIVKVSESPTILFALQGMVSVDVINAALKLADSSAVRAAYRI